MGFKSPCHYQLTLLSASWWLAQDVNSGLLFQCHAYLSAAKCPTMMVMDSPSETVSKPQSKQFLYKLPWSWLSLHNNRKVTQTRTTPTSSSPSLFLGITTQTPGSQNQGLAGLWNIHCISKYAIAMTKYLMISEKGFILA